MGDVLICHHSAIRNLQKEKNMTKFSKIVGATQPDGHWHKHDVVILSYFSSCFKT